MRKLLAPVRSALPNRVSVVRPNSTGVGLLAALVLAAAAITPGVQAQTGATFSTVYEFSALSIDLDGNLDGALPQGSLVAGADGNFYGTTSTGGTGNGVGGAGTVFKVTPGGALTTLHYFSGGVDGGSPAAGLLEGPGGAFYGTTADTVFRITPAGALTTLYTFSALDASRANPDGSDLTGNLIQGGDGNLYGTAQGGGPGTGGTVFRLSPTGILTTLHAFGAADGNHANTGGARPIAGLTQGGDGNFYGTTFYGGAGGYGTVFRLTPAGALTTLHAFDLSDGAHPYAGLLSAPDGNLYGTTVGGGANGKGTVFRLTPAGALTTLHSFNGSDGAYPGAMLVQGNDSNFYGTTQEGGTNDTGTIFQVTPAGALTNLHRFAAPVGEGDNFSGPNSDGADPLGALVQGSDGNFYGVANAGGPGGTGAIFRVVPAGVLAITSPASAAVLAGHPFSYQLTATGSPTTLTVGALPAGLSYDAATHVIVGTPPTVGNATIALSASNAGGEVHGVLALNVADLPTVTLAVEAPTVEAGSGGIGGFYLSLSAAQAEDVVVNLLIKGTAVNGQDYQLLKATKKIKAGRTVKQINIRPLGNLGGASKRTVKLTVEPGAGYKVDGGATAKVKILQ